MAATTRGAVKYYCDQTTFKTKPFIQNMHALYRPSVIKKNTSVYNNLSNLVQGYCRQYEI